MTRLGRYLSSHGSLLWRLGTLLSLVGGLASCGASAQSADTTPIRVLRAGHGNVSGMKKWISANYALCRVGKRLPPEPVPLPSDAALARIAILEEEELFSGQLWARYEVHRTIAPDAAHDCQLVLLSERIASVERTCEGAIKGSSTSIGDLLEGPARPPEVVEERRGGTAAGCGRAIDAARRRSDDLRGLPVVNAGPARCVWTSAILSRDLNAAGMRTATPSPDAGADEVGSDSCLYDKHPSYYYNGFGRQVVLQSKASDRSLSGAPIGDVMGDVGAAGNMRLVEFSDGAPIAPSRFTRAAVEAFLRQPAKSPLGER